MSREERETSNIKQILFIGIILFAVVYLCLYLCALRFSANRAESVENLRLRNAALRREANTRNCFHEYHPIAAVHGSQSNMFLIVHPSISRPQRDNIIIDLQTTRPLSNTSRNIPARGHSKNQNRLDMPPSYEPCPTYEESVSNMEHCTKNLNERGIKSS